MQALAHLINKDERLETQWLRRPLQSHGYRVQNAEGYTVYMTRQIDIVCLSKGNTKFEHLGKTSNKTF